MEEVSTEPIFLEGSSPPLYFYNDTDHGGLTIIITYSFLCVSLGIAAAQLWMNLAYKKRKFVFTDAILLVANLLLLPQAIIVQQSVDNGLGRHIDTVGGTMLREFYKHNYTQQILSIIIQGLAKVSVVILSARIDSVSKHSRTWVYSLAALVAVWTLFSVFSLAFMCNTPNPYIFTNERCAQRYLWYPIIGFNIVTDLLLATVILPIIMKLNMKYTLRLSISALFVSRVLVCFVSIASFAVLSPYLNGVDKTWSSIPFITLTQAVLHSSCITANLPSLHKLLSELQTGQLGAHLPDGIELTEGSGGRYARSRSKQGWNGSGASKGNSGNESGLGSGVRSANRELKRHQSPSESNRELIIED